MTFEEDARVEVFRKLDVISFVMKAHLGQRDKGGDDYFSSHLLPVAQLVPSELFAPALAHDILEDTLITEDDLYDSGIFTDYDISLIRVLTRNDTYTYETYMKDIRILPDATTIKLADIRNNLDKLRLGKLSEAETNRLKEKYRKALLFLHRLED